LTREEKQRAAEIAKTGPDTDEDKALLGRAVAYWKTMGPSSQAGKRLLEAARRHGVG
jgi:hypothetical protein